MHNMDPTQDYFTTDIIRLFEEDETKRDRIENFTTRALQLHFHNPGEHTVNGEDMDLEMHVVHQVQSTH